MNKMKCLAAVAALGKMIREAGSMPVIYECWAKKDEPEAQALMNAAHQRAAGAIGALLAPVGEDWRRYMESRPGLEMYEEDGAHASRAGSDFAAGHIWETIQRDISGKSRAENTQ